MGTLLQDVRYGLRAPVKKLTFTVLGVAPQTGRLCGFRHPGPTVSGDMEMFNAAGFRADSYPPPIRGTRISGGGKV